MTWHKYTIDTTSEAEEAVVAMLLSLGIESVEVEDDLPVEGWFGTVPPDERMPEDVAKISFYVEAKDEDDCGSEVGAMSVMPDADGADADEAGDDEEELLARVVSGLLELRAYMDIGPGTVTSSETRDADWADKWKEYFHEFCVDDIRIVPSWESDGDGADAVDEVDTPGAVADGKTGASDGPGADADVAMTITMDPGMAFGTGKHDTTQLSIRALRAWMKPGDKVLDIGAGSGILGIIALKSGADLVVGTEVDPVALEPFGKNLERNGIDPGDYPLYMIDLTTNDIAFSSFDLVVSNIIAEIIVPICDVVPRYLKEGGIFAASGILREKEDFVRNAMEKNGLSVIDVQVMGDWCGIVARYEP